MNKSYRIVRNSATGQWVVASELTRSRRNTSVTKRILGVAILLAGVAAGAGALDGGTATGIGAVAIGPGSTANNRSSIAIGENALADPGYTGTSAMAIGSDAQATGMQSMALGLRSTAKALNSVAVGTESRSDGDGATAIGQSADAFDLGATALGMGARAWGQGAASFGRFARVEAANGLALGARSWVDQENGVAIGSESLADGSTLGMPAYVPAGQSIAAQTPFAEMSIGQAGKERRITNLASGAADTDAVNVSQLKGVDNRVTSIENSVSSGGGILVKQDPTTRNITVAKSTDGTAVEMGGTQGHRKLTGVADGAMTAGSKEAVNGSQLRVVDQRVTSVTNLATTLDGRVTTVEADVGNLGTVISNLAGDTSSTYISSNGRGVKYVRTNDKGLAAADAHATVAGATALGYNATASHGQSVAIGRDAVSDGSNLSAAPFVPAGQAISGVTPIGEVSIGKAGGERRITSLAAGANNTDAVNLSQLKGVDTRLTAVDGRVTNIDGRVTTIENDFNSGSTGLVKQDPASKNITVAKSLDGTAVEMGGTQGDRKLTGVAAGAVDATSRETVNGSQLHGVDQRVNNVDARVTTVQGNVADLGNQIASIAGDTSGAYISANGRGVKYVRTNDQGLPANDAHATVAGATALGYNATASHAQSVAIGRDAVASGTTLGTAAYLVGGTASGEMSIGKAGGERRIANVAAGASNTDAVNVAQLKSLEGKITSVAGGNYLTYDDAGDTSLTLTGPATSDGGKTGGTRIRNLARGALNANSADVVNGSQLFEVDQRVSSVDGRVATVEGNVTNLGNAIADIAGDTNSTYVTDNGAGVKYVRTNDSGLPASDARATAAGATALGYNATASHEQSVAIGRDSVANGATIVMPAYLMGGSAIGEVSMGKPGMERRVTNVAAGAGDTDAVNVAQLKSLAGKVDTVASGNYAVYDDADDTSLTLSGPSSSDGGKTGGTKLRNVSRGDLSAGSTDAVNGAQLHEVDQRVTVVENKVTEARDYTDTRISEMAGSIGGASFVSVNDTHRKGTPSRPTGENAMSAGAGAVASGKNSVAIGNGSMAAGENSVALGAHSVADRPNTVSVGSAGNERQITHVAAGTAPTDAANLQQVQEAQASAVQQANAYTDVRVNQVQSDMDGVRRDSNAAAASAMAVANLPQSINPGRSMASVAVSNMAGESAMAVGVSRVSESGRWITKLSGTVNTRGNLGVGAGVGYQW